MIASFRLVVRIASFAAVFAFASAAWAGNEAVEKPVNKLIKSVRYSKDVEALTTMDAEAETKFLVADSWEKGTPEQRAEFGVLFHKLFAVLAFPKFRENFQYLDTMVYDAPKMTGDTAEITSVIVINHPLKKQELKVKYAMHKTKAWQVVDVTVLGTGGPSMLTDLRDTQVQPLLKKGGWDGLLKAMRDRLAQVAPKK